MRKIKTMRKRIFFYLCLMLFYSGCTLNIDDTSVPADLKVTQFHYTDYYYLEDRAPVFRQISVKESFRLFEEKATCVLLFSRPSCEICNLVVPCLDAEAKRLGRTVYYVDVEADEIRQMEDDDALEMFRKLFAYMDDILPEDPYSPGEKTMYVPLVVKLKEGTVIAEVQGLPENVAQPEDGPLKDQEEMKMRRILRDVITRKKK